MSQLCWIVSLGTKISMSNGQNCDKDYHEQKSRLKGLLVLVINEVLLCNKQDKHKLKQGQSRGKEKRTEQEAWKQ